MDIYSAALGGLTDATNRTEETAARLARVPAQLQRSVAGEPVDSDTVDLSAEMITLIESRNQAETAVKVAHTAQDLDRATLDLLG